MQITITPMSGVVIEFDTGDGYDFAERPGERWPGSALRYGPDNKRIEIDADGDIVDEQHLGDAGSDEIGAFIGYALKEARSQIDELLTVEERKHAGRFVERVYPPGQEPGEHHGYTVGGRERIWNGTVVREKHGAKPMKGVVISQTQNPDRVVVRYEGGMAGEWEEFVWNLVVLDEQPLVDGTRAYSGGGNGN